MRPLNGPFSGWRMVLMSALVVYCAAPGMTYGTAAFVDPVTSELGLSRSLFSSAYAISTILSAVILLLIGRQFDRWGSRRLMALAPIGLAIGLTWLSFAEGSVWIFVGFAITRTFGQGIMPLAARILVPHWFLRQRGRAYSLIGIAGTLSIASMPPAHEWLIDRFGWRETWRIDAALLMLVLAPIVWLVVRDEPERLGQHQDGYIPDTGTTALPSDSGLGLSLGAATRTFAFWALIAASSIPMGIVTGLSLDQVGIYQDRGFPASLSAVTFTIESISMFAATVVIGATLSRISLRYLLLASQVLIALAMIVLLTTDDLWTGILYASLRGAAMGIVLIAADVAWATWYGRKHLGSIRSFAAAIGVFISALGPLPLGFAIDRFGSYAPAIAGMLVLPVICAVMLTILNPPVLRPEPVLVGPIS